MKIAERFCKLLFVVTIPLLLASPAYAELDREWWIAKDGLIALALGVAIAGLFIGIGLLSVGLAIWKRK